MADNDMEKFLRDLAPAEQVPVFMGHFMTYPPTPAPDDEITRLPRHSVKQQLVPAERGGLGWLPTARELNVLVAVAETGNINAAVERIGGSYQNAKNMLANLRAKLKAESNLQAYHMLVAGTVITRTIRATYRVEEDPSEAIDEA